MRGNVNYQVQQLYETVKAIGQKKHQAKEDARTAGAKTTAQVAQQTGIHSYATADAYRAVWRQIGEHAKTAYGVKDLERLNGQHVASFLQIKINQGVSRATLDQYAAAAAKMENGLNRYADRNKTGNSYRFDLKEVRALGAKELGNRNHEPRAYADRGKLVEKIEGKAALVAAIQAEGGARFKEARQIKEGQLKGILLDKDVTGQLRGQIEVIGKGGKERTIQVSPATYAQLKGAVAVGGGTFRLENYRSYCDSLKNAAKETGQDYTGSHGLRWSWAQDRMEQCQQKMSYEEALGVVSREMGHERSDITEHYLR